MKTNPETWTVEEIIRESNNAQLAPNLEYQRGIVWQTRQQQMLIDSLLRGYHLPVFYFHVIRVPGRHGENTRFEIIDGQQRVNSITAFRNGEFTLLDPAAPNSRFARHLRDQPCDWANLSFDQLSPESRDRFLNSAVTVAEIVDATINEARDLFVRLQQGSDLTAQERRDALPGEFGGAVERIAGRRGRHYGHPFFQEVMRFKPHTDRGQARQFVAQLITAYFEFTASRRFVDLDKNSVDQHYFNYMELGTQSEVIQSLEIVLDDIYDALRDWQGPRLPNHLALHLFIMWNQLDGHYTNSWKSRMLQHVEDFMLELSEANVLSKSGEINEFHNRYASRARTSSDKRDTIRFRHQFFMEWMHQRLDLVPIDPRRSFDAYEREYVYLKSRGTCAYASFEECDDSERMRFEDSEIHHVAPHSKGGKTVLDNAVLTHRWCNRKIGDELVPPASPTKKCSRCGKAKSIDEFHRREAAKDGRQPWCAECNNYVSRVAHAVRRAEE